MESFYTLVDKASPTDLWLMHSIVIDKLKNGSVQASETASTSSTSSSSRKKSRKLSDLAPYLTSGPEPCYIKTLDNIVKANLICNEGKCFFQMENGTIFKNPSALSQFHSEQITPLHPKVTKPGDGWHHIKLVKNNKRLADIFTNSVVATEKKDVSETQKTLASERSKKWAEEAHAILAVLRASNPDATYNDAQKELKKRKAAPVADTESVITEAPKKYIDSVVLKFISRLSQKDNAADLLMEKFGMSLEDANNYLSN